MAIITGDALEILSTVPDDSIQCCVTSPPYWGLRDYGTAEWEGGDPDCKHLQELPHFNGPKQTKQQVSGHASKAEQHKRRHCQDCGARRVDRQLGLEETPEEYVVKLVKILQEVRRVLKPDGTCWLNLGDSYAQAKGHGHWTSAAAKGDEHQQKVTQRWKHMGAEDIGLKQKDLVGIPWRVAFALQQDGWYLRQDIIWAKPNPMPESVLDRCTKSHEYLFMLAKSARYYFDSAAIAEPAIGKNPGNKGHKGKRAYDEGEWRFRTKVGLEHIGPAITRNKRTVWTIATRRFPGAHFATFPEQLVEPCILAGSRPGDQVLDPFCGSGTVGAVAQRHGREFLGIDLNPEYCAMAERRISEVIPELDENSLSFPIEIAVPESVDPRFHQDYQDLVLLDRMVELKLSHWQAKALVTFALKRLEESGAISKMDSPTVEA